MTTIPRFPIEDRDYHAIDVSRALAGLLRRDVNGNISTGVLGSTLGLVTAVPSSWQVKVRPFGCVIRIDQGAQFTGLHTAVNVDIESASSIPARQSRIDRVCFDWQTEQIVVIKGTAALTPTAPQAPFAHYSLALVAVKAGDSTVISSQITVNAVRTWTADETGRVIRGRIAARSVPAGGNVKVPITFPAGTFSETPNVQVTLEGAANGCVASISGVSANGFTIYLSSSVNAKRTVGAHYRAEQG